MVSVMQNKSQKKLKLKTVGTRLPLETYNKIVILLSSSDYTSISDYIRDLIRKDLEKIQQ